LNDKCSSDEEAISQIRKTYALYGDPIDESNMQGVDRPLPNELHNTIPLKQPFSGFFTATVRAGSKPSSILDMLGTLDGVKNSIHYARVRIK
jgi:hypothetical protein